jgi:predicted RNA binding protein YcfA (HicA-like mRNA interferase family)
VPKLPSINHRAAVRALEKAGFRVAREEKHVVMTDGKRILTIPRANPVNAFTMGGIVRDAGLSIDEFKTQNLLRLSRVREFLSRGLEIHLRTS